MGCLQSWKSHGNSRFKKKGPLRGSCFGRLDFRRLEWDLPTYKHRVRTCRTLSQAFAEMLINCTPPNKYIFVGRVLVLTCFHASFFPFCPLCWPPLFPFSRHIFFALFSPSKSALFCRPKGTAQSLERGTSDGWTSPQSSGRKLLPEICIKKGQGFLSPELLVCLPLQRCVPWRLHWLLGLQCGGGMSTTMRFQRHVHNWAQGFAPFSASSKPTTEFAQPRLSRVKGRLCPARRYKFGCVCSYMAGVISHQGNDTGHKETNAPKFVPPRWGRPPFGLCKLQIRSWVSTLELAEPNL